MEASNSIHQCEACEQYYCANCDQIHDSLATGAKVGARRWPYYGAHPDCWSKPWSGVVLAIDDPRAWAGTLAFPFGLPTQVEVDAHVARWPTLGASSVPVLWDFGSSGLRVHWEPTRTGYLLPYADDLEAWFEARNDARREAA